MPKSNAVAGVVAVSLAAAVLSACSDAPSSQGLGYIEGTGLVRTLEPNERVAVGSVAGETLDGEEVSVSDFAGQTVVLNFWWSQCPPCRAEAPDLADAARGLRGQDVVFLGINIREPSPEQALAFERTFDVPYPSLYDPDGNTLLAFSGILSPYSIPSTIVIDAQGRIAATVLGSVTKSTLLGLVEDVEDTSPERQAS